MSTENNKLFFIEKSLLNICPLEQFWTCNIVQRKKHEFQPLSLTSVFQSVPMTTNYYETSDPKFPFMEKYDFCSKTTLLHIILSKTTDTACSICITAFHSFHLSSSLFWWKKKKLYMRNKYIAKLKSPAEPGDSKVNNSANTLSQ